MSVPLRKSSGTIIRAGFLDFWEVTDMGNIINSLPTVGILYWELGHSKGSSQDELRTVRVSGYTV